ncbi:MAG: asparagine synthase (glutamine-hydrolyzing) [Gemmatimonadaceae bacterium]|nr:asparagine synthase (glutamine-hydrolyzing) [Gemmatimonadaceae bacterium]
MCGIAGFQGAFPPELLARMSRAVAHRGPDGDGHVFLGRDANVPVGLAHRRLAIIDLSADGRQPMTARCPRCRSTSLDDLALIYNGELYEYRALRAELEAKGHRFHSQTDSEVLLHLYTEYGTAMLERLNGIFAFAIYDGRSAGHPAGIARGDLFIARDPLGVKPLYYTTTREGLLFASELKALLQHEALPRRIDAAALHHHLAYLWTPAPRTLLEGVRKLPPGCALIARGGGVAREWRYYDLPYGRASVAGSESEIAGELRARVARAVERQLVADVPVGAFLSGGLDSSAVVAMMRRAHPDRAIDCYGIGFAGDEAIEGTAADMPYARRVAAHLGVRLHVLEVQPTVIEHLERMLYFLDEPQADPAPINALLIAEQARRDGISVLLSGAGGDDILSGYRRHLAVRSEHLWMWLPRAARGVVARAARAMASGNGPRGASSHAVRRLVKMLSYVDQAPDTRLATYFWWSPDAMRRSLYSPALEAATRDVATAAPLLETLERLHGEADPLNRMLYLEGKHFLPDHNLNYTDKMGMAAGVEVRVPLLDLELIDFAVRIPSAMKQRGRTGKAIFKRAMEPDLPREVIYRAKSGFGAPLRRWLRNELRAMVEETLAPAALRRRGLFDPAGVHRLVELDRTGQVDGGYTIFALMCIELWCRQFIDAVPQPVETGASASLHGVDQQEQPMVREETAHGPARPHGLGDR